MGSNSILSWENDSPRTMAFMVVLAMFNVVLWGTQGFGLVAMVWLIGIPVFGYRMVDAME